mgnify:CR=1 FL=1
MTGQPSENSSSDRGTDGPGKALRKLSERLLVADPNRLNTPAGRRIIDIYRKAYVSGGLSTADARRVHWIWFVNFLMGLPALLMILLPATVLLALELSGFTPVPREFWSALLFSTAADVTLTPPLYMLIAAPLHARGVPLALRTPLTLLALTLIVIGLHQGLHLLFPWLFTSFAIYVPPLLVFQGVVLFVYLFGVDVHIDYARVTSRWTDTPLQRLLPYDKRGNLIFLRASDHYVIVRTTKGEHELRMRFADALERIGNARGLQVHRSFWVAQEYLTAPRKEGRRMVMRVDGVMIPISATYRDDVVRHLDLASQGPKG